MNKKLLILLTSIITIGLTGCNMQTNQPANQNSSQAIGNQNQIQAQNQQQKQNKQQKGAIEKPLTNKKIENQQQAKNGQQATTTAKSKKFYTMEDVKKHNIPGDCRTVINGKVYDLSGFFGKHPGGNENLAKLCGIDGTEKFMQKHGNNQKVLQKLPEFYKGELVKNEDK